MKRTTSGFTIVELLIVVVVIGILAAITIMAYNGIQQRSKNTARINAAKQWQKIITLYTADKQQYPYVSGHVCLGSGYLTNWDDNPDEDCLISSSIKHPNATVTAAFLTMGSNPNYPTEVQDSGNGTQAVGISFRRSDILDPSGVNIPNYPHLWYYLNGNNQDCGLRPIITPASGGITINSSAINSGNYGTLTACRVGLPDPTAL